MSRLGDRKVKFRNRILKMRWSLFLSMNWTRNSMKTGQRAMVRKYRELNHNKQSKISSFSADIHGDTPTRNCVNSTRDCHTFSPSLHLHTYTRSQTIYYRWKRTILVLKTRLLHRTKNWELTAIYLLICLITR